MYKLCFVCGTSINKIDIKCTHCGNEYYVVWYNLVLWLLLFHLFFMMFAHPIHNWSEIGRYLSAAITGTVWIFIYSFLYMFAVSRAFSLLFVPIAIFQYFQARIFDIYLDDFGIVSFPNMIIAVGAICCTLYNLINMSRYISRRITEKDKYVKLASGMYHNGSIAIVGRILDKYKCDVDSTDDDGDESGTPHKPLK